MKTLTLILILFSSNIIFGQNSIEYIRSNELEKIKIDVNDFKKLVSSIEYYCDKKTNDSTNTSIYPTIICNITSKSKALTLSSFKQISNWNIDNETYDKVSFYYSYPNKPISQIEIHFSYYGRNITIKGLDEKKVEALYRDLNEQLAYRKILFSKIEIGIIISIFMYLLFMFSVYLMPTSFNLIYKGERKKSTIFIFLLTLSYFIFYSFYLYSDMSVRNFFPGFELTPDNLSWIDRNTNLLGFIGFIITLITIIFGFLKWIFKAKSTN